MHDIHLSEHDVISDQQFAIKLESIKTRDTLKIGYIGRLHPMKAPEDWIDIVSRVCEKIGAERIEAVWLGDGPLLSSAKANVEARGLTKSIQFKGFVSDRNEILTFLREIDIFLFCHITPESPRCLIESLISGTPLVGYESSYAHDLVGDRGGALLEKIKDIQLLADIICNLADNRSELVTVTGQAAESKGMYNDKAVFMHRSELIKQYL